MTRLKDDILSSAAGPRIARVFTAISDRSALESNVVTQLRAAGCAEVLLGTKVEKKVQEEMQLKHNVGDAINHAISELGHAARRG